MLTRQTVPLPASGVSRKKGKNDVTYIYLVLRSYRDPAGKPKANEVSIGKLDRDTGDLIPNKNYYAYCANDLPASQTAANGNPHPITTPATTLNENQPDGQADTQTADPGIVATAHDPHGHPGPGIADLNAQATPAGISAPATQGGPTQGGPTQGGVTQGGPTDDATNNPSIPTYALEANDLRPNNFNGAEAAKDRYLKGRLFNEHLLGNEYYDEIKKENAGKFEYGHILIMKTMAEKSGLSGILRAYFPNHWREILNLAIHMSTEGSEIPANNPWPEALQPDGADEISDQSRKRIFSEITGLDKADFFNEWVGHIGESTFSVHDLGPSPDSVPRFGKDPAVGPAVGSEKPQGHHLAVFVGAASKLPAFYRERGGNIPALGWYKNINGLEVNEIIFFPGNDHDHTNDLDLMRPKNLPLVIPFPLDTAEIFKFHDMINEKIYNNLYWMPENKLYGFCVDYNVNDIGVKAHVFFDKFKDIKNISLCTSMAYSPLDIINRHNTGQILQRYFMTKENGTFNMVRTKEESEAKLFVRFIGLILKASLYLETKNNKLTYNIGTNEIIRKLKRFKIATKNGIRIVDKPSGDFQSENVGLFLNETFADA
ncbi:MAG: hypothetical protein LBF58_05475 [Deltaproteobacteria bacterium]|jgi:hypothetical protein|nr:hypothetical protein [Deltaproteobacteria bacterium]